MRQLYMSVLFYLRRMPLKIVAGAALGLLVFVSFFRGCGTPVEHGRSESHSEVKDSLLDVKLSPNGVIRVRTEDGEERREYVPDDGTAVVTVKPDGVVEVDVKRAGVTFKPGMSALVTDRLRLGADFQIGYWK